MTREAIALTPKPGGPRGGLCISPLALQPADIIVSTSDDGLSKIIRGWTDSPVSHAILCLGSNQVIEAIFRQGVTIRGLDDSLARATLAVAYRHRRMTKGKSAVVVARAFKRWRSGYDLKGAIGAGVCLEFKVGCSLASQDRWYCSELVLEAFQHAGVPIVNIDPHRSFPQQIVNAYVVDHVLEYLGHLRP